jgi:hypothetical protein
VSALGEAVELSAGHLSTNETFSIPGIERASLTVTVSTPQQGPAVELIGDQDGA